MEVHPSIHYGPLPDVEVPHYRSLGCLSATVSAWATRVRTHNVYGKLHSIDSKKLAEVLDTVLSPPEIAVQETIYDVLTTSAWVGALQLLGDLAEGKVEEYSSGTSFLIASHTHFVQRTPVNFCLNHLLTEIQCDTYSTSRERALQLEQDPLIVPFLDYIDPQVTVSMSGFLYVKK